MDMEYWGILSLFLLPMDAQKCWTGQSPRLMDSCSLLQRQKCKRRPTFDGFWFYNQVRWCARDLSPLAMVTINQGYDTDKPRHGRTVDFVCITYGALEKVQG